MSKYKYTVEKGVEYEISYYSYITENEIYLYRVYQDMEGGECDVDFASTEEDYSCDLIFDEDNMISEKEFNKLYKKYKKDFRVNTFLDSI